MGTLMRYDEFVARYEAAYAAFKKVYVLRHPPPSPPRARRVSWITVALAFLLAASVLVSGSRTVDEFGGFPVGVAAFVMLECALVAYAFFRKRRSSDALRLEHTRRLASVGLAVAFTVALAANVDDVLRDGGVWTGEGVKLMIALLVAASAPVLALISGDMLAAETLVAEAKRRQEQQAYEALLEAWNAGLNVAWNAQRARWGVRVESLADDDALASLPLSTSGQLTASGRRSTSGQSSASGRRSASGQSSMSGHAPASGQLTASGQRSASGQDALLAYLDAHPDAAQRSVRALAAEVGVSKSTVAAALRVWRARQGGG